MDIKVDGDGPEKYKELSQIQGSSVWAKQDKVQFSSLLWPNLTSQTSQMMLMIKELRVFLDQIEYMAFLVQLRTLLFMRINHHFEEVQYLGLRKAVCSFWICKFGSLYEVGYAFFGESLFCIFKTRFLQLCLSTREFWTIILQYAS